MQHDEHKYFPPSHSFRKTPTKFCPFLCISGPPFVVVDKIYDVIIVAGY